MREKGMQWRIDSDVSGPTGTYGFDTRAPVEGGTVDDATTAVLDALRAAGEPISPAMVAERTGLDRKDVDKAMNSLKKAGQIESPVRCKWQPRA